MPPRRPNLSNIIPPSNDWEAENRPPPQWTQQGFDIAAFALTIAVATGVGCVIVALLVRFAMWIL